MDFQTGCIIIIIVISVAAFIYNFVKMGRERQIENIKEWLIFACLEAQKLLGSKTGQVKLRYVYDLFVSKYKFMSYIIPFETFSDWVDESLVNVRNMINTNEAVRKMVEGGE